MEKKYYLIFVLLFITLITSSSRLKKGFEALDCYNYFEAKRKFEKVKKRHHVPASFGLSIIYQRNDNPFTNLDSAYTNIVSACLVYKSLQNKQKEKYKK